MQIVSIGDNLHEMSKPVFLEKINKKYVSMSSAENFTSMISTKHNNDWEIAAVL